MSGESPILETEQAAQAMTSTSRAEKPEKPAKRDACTMRDLIPFFHKKSN
jgi:hypothetical protein